jgi:hypothetical protein
MAWTQNTSPARIDRKTIAEGANKYISRAELPVLFANALWSRRGDRSTYANLSKRWIGFSEDDGSRSPKAQMLGGSAAVTFCQRVEDNAFHLAKPREESPRRADH